MPSQPEKDKEAKNAARTSSLVTKPGAVAVPADQAARLDQRIQNKRSINTSAKQQLSRVEQDVMSKQQVRGSEGVSRPGAFSSTVLQPAAVAGSDTKRRFSPATLDQLQSLDDAVSAKVRNNAPSSSTTPGARDQLNSLEDAVATKTRIGNVTNVNAAIPGARAQLASLEDAVTNKVRGEGSVGARAQLDSLEERVAGKEWGVEGNGASPRHGAMAQLTSLDDEVTSKARTASTTAVVARSQLDEMEADIDAKRENGRVSTSSYDTPTSSKQTIPIIVTNDPSKQMDIPSGDKDGSELPKVGEGRPEQAMGAGNAHDTDLEFGTMSNGLAVAVAVKDDESDEFIPAAVEYDPDAKPPMYRNRRFRLYFVLAFIIIVAVGVGAAVGVTMKASGNEGSLGPPVPYRETIGIREQVERIVGSEILNDPVSPYTKAVEWVIYEDPMQLEPEAANFMQRYLMAYFYFATVVDGPWRNCNPTVTNETDFCNFEKLLSIFPEFFEGIPSTRWLSQEAECEWAGVFCDEYGQVRAIDLNGNGLSGPFPEGLTYFPFLQSVSLAWGNLRGSLPTEIVEMKHLVNIELHYNKFTGEVPLEWWRARNLVRINLAENSIEGEIPPEIKNLEDVKGLFLSENLFRGTLPDEIGDLSSVSFFRLSRNLLEGTLPSTVGQMSQLGEIWLHRNYLTGALPTEIGNLSKLARLRLQFNSFRGELPGQLYGLTSLDRLDLYNCNFTGTISPAIGNLTNMSFLRLHDNNFFGGIPTELGQLSVLSSLMLQGNQLTGTIPDSICEVRQTWVPFEELEADCAGSSSGGPEVTCPDLCCTSCCDRQNVCTPTPTRMI